jgi:3-hydroxyacyl-CoA dehydrogenase
MRPQTPVAVLGTGIMGSAMAHAISLADGGPPPLLAALSRQWHAAVEAGHGRQDISAARLALPG